MGSSPAVPRHGACLPSISAFEGLDPLFIAACPVLLRRCRHVRYRYVTRTG